MPRSGSSTTLLALAQGLVRPALFISVENAGDPLLMWTGYGTFTWGGDIYHGAGPFYGINGIEEGSTVQAKGIVLSLEAVPSSIINTVLTDLRINKTALVYLGALDESGALVDTPILAFAGYVDEPSINDGGETCTVAVNCEDVLIDLNHIVYRRYTQADQQLDYPEDTGAQYVVGIQELTDYWGVIPNSNNR